MSRNLGIEMARGELIAILDGDDLYSKNWLCDAYDFYSKSENKNLCLHPQYNLIFEGSIGWWKHIEQQSKYFSPIYLMTVNYWQSNCIFPKVLHKKCTYSLQALKKELGMKIGHLTAM